MSMADKFSPTLQKKIDDSATEAMAPTHRSTPARVSNSRAENLALIDQYLEDAKKYTEPESLTPSIAPPPSSASKAQKEEAAASLASGEILKRNEEQRRKALTQEQEDILAQQKKLLGEEEAARLRKEQEELNARSKLRSDVERGVSSAGDILHGADTRIGAIPQPGSIVFPLLLLLVFFFILIQVGGYSRIQWLWLVLTGNASLGATSNASNAQATAALNSLTNFGTPAATSNTQATTALNSILNFGGTNGVYGGSY